MLESFIGTIKLMLILVVYWDWSLDWYLLDRVLKFVVGFMILILLIVDGYGYS